MEKTYSTNEALRITDSIYHPVKCTTKARISGHIATKLDSEVLLEQGSSKAGALHSIVQERNCHVKNGQLFLAVFPIAELLDFHGHVGTGFEVTESKHSTTSKRQFGKGERIYVWAGV